MTHGTEIMSASRDFFLQRDHKVCCLLFPWLRSDRFRFCGISFAPSFELCAILRIESEFQDQSWNLNFCK